MKLCHIAILLKILLNKLINMKRLFYNCAYGVEYKQIGDSVNYAFVEQENTLYIYFQGSNSVSDWVFNFLFAKKVYGLFKVHRGFLHCYQQVRSLMLDKAYSKNYDEIVVVGYSHGGALCQLALQDLVYHFPNISVKGFAFESPRCLKVPKKYRYMWDNLRVIRTNNDLITHLPPKIFGFSDLGTMIKVKGDTSLVKGNLPKCIKSHFPQVVYNALSISDKKWRNA